MLQDELYKVMLNIEIFIDSSYTFFGSYRVVKKDKLFNLFKMLYNALPQQLISNRDYLNSKKEENIFSLLGQVSVLIEKSKKYLGYILVNKNTILDIIDKIYATLPEDILICRGDED